MVSTKRERGRKLDKTKQKFGMESVYVFVCLFVFYMGNPPLFPEIYWLTPEKDLEKIKRHILSQWDIWKASFPTKLIFAWEDADHIHLVSVFWVHEEGIFKLFLIFKSITKQLGPFNQ